MSVCVCREGRKEADGVFFLNVNFYISSKRFCAIKKIGDEFLLEKERKLIIMKIEIY